MNLFEFIKPAKVKRSMFDLSHEKKLSMKMGDLIPVLLQEVIPGDDFKINTESMVRFAPLISPVMHRVDAYIHYFYVPWRTVWSSWEDFITGKQAINLPTVDYGTPITERTLFDYMGIPPNVPFDNLGDNGVNSLPFRAYKSIWNEYYRDQDLQVELDITDDTDDFDILKRCWEKDYFTSARPWAQKGTAMTLGADVLGSQYMPARAVGGANVTNGNIQLTDADGTRGNLKDSNNVGIGLEVLYDLEADIDINELRTATRIQRWLERNARAGSRYVEHLLAHWGVLSDDARLDRPEYIGGGRSPVTISEVLNTTGSEDANAHAVGSLAGHGINVGTTNTASKYCKEHGIIMGIMSVIPQSNYYQGVDRMFTRNSVYDFPFPEFARLGEQEVLMQELRAEPTQAGNTQVFGYQSRYAEWKYANSTVHGDFRGNLNHWHMARGWGETPALNGDFVAVDPDNDEITRIFNVTDTDADHLWVQLYHNIRAKRPLPFFNDPTL